MAIRRQKLSQRRKAVGLTQESLAEHLGVERSTVIRWEAGESQPLPSIRPNLARALHVSIDQLTELLTQSEDAGKASPADPEVATPVPARQDQRSGGPELDGLVHSQVAETVEALRRALHSAGVSAEDLAAMLLIGGSARVPLAGSGVPAPRHPEAPDLSAPAAIPPTAPAAERRRRRAGSRGCKRWAAVGLLVLGLPAAWLSTPFVISHSGLSPQAGAGTSQSAAPVVAIPAPNPGSNPGQVDTATGPAPSATPADAPAPPAGAAVPVTHTTKVTRTGRTVSRSTRPTKTYPRSPRPPEWVLPAGERWADVSQLERIGQFW